MSRRAYVKVATALALAIALILATLIPTFAFTPGQSPRAPYYADYVIVKGKLHEDYYSLEQYKHKLGLMIERRALAVNETWNESQGAVVEALTGTRLASLRIGFTEYGEFATPAHAGLAYGTSDAEWDSTESWASKAVAEKFWVQGWFLAIEFVDTMAGEDRLVIAYAIYSNRTVEEAGRGVWIRVEAPTVTPFQKVEGGLIPHGIKVLYEDSRLFIARLNITITTEGVPDWGYPIADVVFTIIFPKVEKKVIVLKDVKLKIPEKILGRIKKFVFAQHYELDLAAIANPGYRSYIHYFHNVGESVYKHPIIGWNKFDIVQAFTPDMKYVFFAMYWPNATEYSVYAPAYLIPNPPKVTEAEYPNWPEKMGILPPGTKVTDIPAPPVGPGEPETPFIVVQWMYKAKEKGGTDFEENVLAKLKEKRQIRFVEVIGMTDYNDAEDIEAGVDVDNDGKLEYELDTEVKALAVEVFYPREDLSRLPEYLKNFEYRYLVVGRARDLKAGFVGSMAEDVLGASALYEMISPALPALDKLSPYESAIPWLLCEFDTATGLPKKCTSWFIGKTKLTKEPVLGLINFTYYVKTDQPVAGEEDVYEAKKTAIVSVGGPIANWITKYFNDFAYYALFREGVDIYSLVEGGAVKGMVPTCILDESVTAPKPLDVLPVVSWNVSMYKGFSGRGVAVITITEDVNGTVCFAVWGWTAQDTYWAALWARAWLDIVPSKTGFTWPEGTKAIILLIKYPNGKAEPIEFTVEKVLGTITELEVCFQIIKLGNTWYIDLCKDGSPDIDLSAVAIWPWFKKVIKPTNATATIQYDP